VEAVLLISVMLLGIYQLPAAPLSPLQHSPFLYPMLYSPPSIYLSDKLAQPEIACKRNLSSLILFKSELRQLPPHLFAPWEQ
jgi:hypothetical protein